MAITTDQKSSLLFKKYVTGKAETGSQFSFFEEFFESNIQIPDNQILSEFSLLPQTNPVINQPTGTIHIEQGSPLIEVFNTVNLDHIPGTGVNGTPYAFIEPIALTNPENQNLLDIIPFTTGDGSYNYIIRNNINGIITTGTEDWYFDPTSGILVFFSGNLPNNVSTNPGQGPRITCYKYIGLKGLSNSTSGGLLETEYLNAISPVIAGSDNQLGSNQFISNQAKGDIIVSINGQEVSVGRNINDITPVNVQCYFSTSDAGLDVVENPNSSSFFIWNGNYSRYDLDENDTILIKYQI